MSTSPGDSEAASSSSSATNTTISTYIRDPKEVYTVRSYLLRWVPLELADTIMDEARYWPTIISSASSHSPDLWLPDWPAEGHASVRIKEVCFTITSCDQGWTTDPGPFRTNYHGSFTWFEAFVARNFQDYPTSRDDLYKEADVRDRIQISVRRSEKLRSKKDIIASKWQIQRNFRASPFYRTHRVVWSAKDTASAAVNEQDARKYDEKTGAYRAAGFVQTLLPGDRIGIIMKAKVSVVKRRHVLQKDPSRPPPIPESQTNQRPEHWIPLE
ncbi:hypothetical protein CVT25_007166 [Psilocybe cyanescens]|uniref:Uncharacterized protein n=1 Tax=Psilocybe cyanescens TaxID=93625 RepID=A0A409WVN8_PSICY|nr:hypothetical protein CVT25_007166 [Psilocybe cyanescens]